MSEEESEIYRIRFLDIEDEDILLLLYLRLGKESGNKAMGIMYDKIINCKSRWLVK
jgi:hypothetical protein